MHLANLAAASTGLFSSVTSDLLMGVFDSVTDVIPIVVPVVIAFIGFRKAWSFLVSQVAGA